MNSLMWVHVSNSSKRTAISCVEKPRFIKVDIRKMVKVITPRPPICVKIIIIICPKVVKFSMGTVMSPVTQVIDVAVKKRSKRLIGTVRAAGNESAIMPRPIVTKKINMIILSGDKNEKRFILIRDIGAYVK